VKRKRRRLTEQQKAALFAQPVESQRAKKQQAIWDAITASPPSLTESEVSAPISKSCVVSGGAPDMDSLQDTAASTQCDATSHQTSGSKSTKRRSLMPTSMFTSEFLKDLEITLQSNLDSFLGGNMVVELCALRGPVLCDWILRALKLSKAASERGYVVVLEGQVTQHYEYLPRMFEMFSIGSCPPGVFMNMKKPEQRKALFALFVERLEEKQRKFIAPSKSKL
jgi:hypothetical protein